jgi:hypothetical protein
MELAKWAVVQLVCMGVIVWAMSFLDLLWWLRR